MQNEQINRNEKKATTISYLWEKCDFNVSSLIKAFCVRYTFIIDKFGCLQNISIFMHLYIGFGARSPSPKQRSKLCAMPVQFTPFFVVNE